MAKTLREMFAGYDPSLEPSIRDLVGSEVDEITPVDQSDQNPLVYARTPGDPEDHPLDNGPISPMPGVDRIEMFRMLMDGRITGPLRAKVKQYLSVC